MENELKPEALKTREIIINLILAFHAVDSEKSRPFSEHPTKVVNDFINLLFGKFFVTMWFHPTPGSVVDEEIDIFTSFSPSTQIKKKCFFAKSWKLLKEKKV